MSKKPGAIHLAVSCDKATEPKEEPKNPEERVFGITLLSQNSNPLVGARVVIPLKNTRYALTTNSSGQCEFHIPNAVNLPEYVVTVIDHSTILPAAVTFPGATDARYSRSYTCRSVPSRIYIKECTLHHLGNDLYGGPENSQLQIPTEGISISRTFSLSAIPSRMPNIRLYARGVQHPTEIWINGKLVAQLGNSDPDGDLSLYDFQPTIAPGTIFKVGTNTIMIKTAPYDPKTDPWNDIEFCSFALYI